MAFQQPGTPAPMPDNRRQQIGEAYQQQPNRQQNQALQQHEQPDPKPALAQAETLADQFNHLLQSQQERKEEDRLYKTANTLWRDYERLHGRENFMEWKKNMLVDADYISARNVLLGKRTHPRDDRVEEVKWKASAQLLHSRLRDMMSRRISQQVLTSNVLAPCETWHRLESLFGISRAEERFMTVKAMIDLKTESNGMAKMRNWQHLQELMAARKHSLDEICHDIGIISLGDYQKDFVRIQLGDLFYASKRGEAHVLDMDKFINQLESRAE